MRARALPLAIATRSLPKRSAFPAIAAASIELVQLCNTRVRTLSPKVFFDSKRGGISETRGVRKKGTPTTGHMGSQSHEALQGARG